MGWGRFCLPAAGRRPTVAEGDDEYKEVGASNVDSNGESHNGFMDIHSRRFALMGRSDRFEEECTSDSRGARANCILCLAGQNPPVCVDANQLRRHMRMPVTYENAF